MGYDGDGRSWGMSGMDAGDWLVMSVLMLVFLALVGVLVYALVRASTARSGWVQGDLAPHARSTAETTLDERFARGEIDQPEYQQRKAALRSG